MVTILAILFGLAIGYFIGMTRGLRKGLGIGKDMEFYLFTTSLKKLRIQTKYTDLVDDVGKQYTIELNNIIEDLTGERR